jgi:hypothetical protein
LEAEIEGIALSSTDYEAVFNLEGEREDFSISAFSCPLEMALTPDFQQVDL